MKKVLAILLALAMVFALAACGEKKEEQKEPEQPAGPSGELIMYTTVADAQLDATIAAFNALYPDVKVSYTYAGAGDCKARIQSEASNPQADVMFGGLQFADLGAYGQYFEDYVCANDSFMMADYQNTSGKLTFHDAQIPCMLVNEALEKEAGVTITGWNSLLDPALTGKIAIANPTSSSSAWNWLQCLLTDFGGWESQEAWDYIAKFIPQVKLQDSSSAPLKKTFGDEYVCGLTYEPLVIMNAENCFPKCRVVYWEEGTTSVGFASAIIKGAKNLDNAKLFMDFLESPEGQSVYAQSGARPVTTQMDKVEGASELMVDLSTIKYLEADTAALAEHKAEICDKWNELWAQYSTT